MPKIREIAQVAKSRNSGPFEITIDVVFAEKAMFERVKRTGMLSAALFARLYRVPEADVLFTVYDAGHTFKATLPRLVPAGDIGTRTFTAPSSTHRCSRSRSPSDGRETPQWT